jgi:hypothetical protein
MVRRERYGCIQVHHCLWLLLPAYGAIVWVTRGEGNEAIEAAQAWKEGLNR